MYDTEKRVALVKKRIAEHRRRQVRRSIRSLSALCVLLFLSLVGTVGTVQGQPMDTAGMYGAILLHEGAGGYVLVAVAVMTALPGFLASTKAHSSGRSRLEVARITGLVRSATLGSLLVKVMI